MGYLLGTLSPAALIAALKHKSLRDNGTGNLGATNTMLVFGKKCGAIVMLFDVCKGFLAVKLTTLITPELEWLPLAAGVLAVIGHCFPFYLKFKGGKGLAAFGGVVLACRPVLCLVLVGVGVVLMILVNYSFVLPYSLAVGFAAFTCAMSPSLTARILAVAVSAFIMATHFGNLLKAQRGQDLQIRPFIREKIFKRK